MGNSSTRKTASTFLFSSVYVKEFSRKKGVVRPFQVQCAHDFTLIERYFLVPRHQNITPSSYFIINQNRINTSFSVFVTKNYNIRVNACT